MTAGVAAVAVAAAGAAALVGGDAAGVEAGAVGDTMVDCVGAAAFCVGAALVVSDEVLGAVVLVGADCGMPTLITIWLGTVGVGDALVELPSLVEGLLDVELPLVGVVGAAGVVGHEGSRCTTGSGYGRSSGVKMLLNRPSRVGDWNEPATTVEPLDVHAVVALPGYCNCEGVRRSIFIHIPLSKPAPSVGTTRRRGQILRATTRTMRVAQRRSGNTAAQTRPKRER